MSYTAKIAKLIPSIEEWTRELAWWIPWDTPRERIAAWDLHGEIIRGQERYPGHDDWHTLKYFQNPVFRTEYVAYAKDLTICCGTTAMIARAGAIAARGPTTITLLFSVMAVLA